MKPRLVIVDGIRTPFCKAGTDLARHDAVELGRIAVTNLLQRTGLNPALIDEVIFGCVSQPADAANIARVIALRSGIPERVPAMTVHRNCASGLESLTMAYEKMCAGRGGIFIVGGTESMSQMPLLFSQPAANKFAKLARAKSFAQRLGAFAAFRPRDFQPRIGLQLGLTDPVCGLNMGETAELLAREFHISREEQDAFALESHQRALAARARLAEEICPVLTAGCSALPAPRSAFTQDNGPRENQSLAALAKLRPVFDKQSGTVTAGNSSQITDGAVALLVMEVERARELGLVPCGALVDYAVTGCDPKRMGLGPLYAMEQLRERTGLNVHDADLIEINEAFAAQTLAVLKGAEFGNYQHADSAVRAPLGAIPRDRLNVNGGAIALGHPVGATGARLNLNQLERTATPPRAARPHLIVRRGWPGCGVVVGKERMKTLETYFRYNTNAAPVAASLPPATIHRTANMLREVDAHGLCTLTFDRANSSANIFDREVLLELNSHLSWMEREPELRGVILASAKPSIFIAGANLHAVAGMTGPELAELIELGQRVFNRLAALETPTIAAIHGAGVGGGYELALACRYRLATGDRATKIGLPEVLLGILPAWGGSTRLPRLIGIPKALEIILNGKTLAAERALQFGMVDEVVSREQLLEVARERLLRPRKLHRPSLRVTNNPISSMLIRARALRELASRTRGNYPAPFEALDVVTHGVSLTMEDSLALERVAVVRLAETPACHNLLRLFLLKERAKKVAPLALRAEVSVKGATPSPRSAKLFTSPVARTAVIGAGVMGAGIAQWLSARGLSVILRDVSLEQLVRGMATVSSLYEDAVRRHHLTKLEARDGKDRIFAAATDLPMRDVDIVIEAATEKLPLKQDIFRCLAAQTGPNTILATNTSALSITEIAAATSAPERVVGLHFFNPVPRMELVEVVAGEKTSPEVVARVVEFARRIGKVSVVVRDRPGFVVNRILMPYLVEAVRLFDAGASAHDIDEAMLDFGMPMGPLRLLDEVGLDVAAHVVGTLEKHFGERVTAPALIEKMLGAGMLGKKSGRGFYDYAHDKPNHELDVLRTVHRHTSFTRDELTRRMMMLMVNEAARCVEEKVASPDDIDLAMVLGTGFAPFTGGPLRYAEAYPVASVVAALEGMAATEPRFAPCDLLKQMSGTGRGRFVAPSSLERACPPHPGPLPKARETGSQPSDNPSASDASVQISNRSTTSLVPAKGKL